MNDDDLNRALEAWAGTTDPDADPITAPEVASASAGDAAPGRSRRWPAVAAAVLVVAALAAGIAVAVDRAGGPDEVVADGEGAEAPGGTDGAGGTATQIVVDAPDLHGSWWQVVHRVVLWGPCPGPVETCADDAGTVLARPLEPGTSLVLDQPLAPGRWLLRVERYECSPDGAEDCGAPSPEGVPERSSEPTACDLPLDVGTGAARLVVAVATPDGVPDCMVAPPGEDVPALTVPPGWSLRPELPWTCGAATHDINGQVPGSDPEGAEVALGCFRTAIADGTPVEIPVAELQAGDGLTRSWWRVLPEPVDGHRVEVLRDWGLDGVHGWARMRCDDVTVETQDVEIGAGGSSLFVSARPTGCAEEEPLSLDLPDLAEPAPAQTTTVLPPDGTVDVVLDVDGLPMFIEGGARRWSVAVDGEERATGPLTEIGGWEGTGTPDVQLVGRSLPLADGQALTVTVEDFDCYLTGHCRPDGMGPATGAEPVDTCRAEAPAERTGPVLVVTLRASTCRAEWTEAVPALTVPPAWTLRPADDGTCADVGRDARWAQCLADAFADGTLTTEQTRYADDGSSRVTYLVVEGRLELFRWTGGPEGATSWSGQTCAGLEVGDGGREVKATRCDDEAPLPLTP